jgi:ABC-type dipeptide/oligopeptide/nickel transport system permease subunit
MGRVGAPTGLERPNASPDMNLGVPAGAPLYSHAARGLWSDVRGRLAHNPAALAGALILVILVVTAVLASVVAPWPYDQGSFGITEAPSWQHPFGTDDLGRDELSRVIYGTQISMSVGIISQSIVLVIGLAVGALSGYFAGKLDFTIMRLTDIVFAIPSVLFALLIMSVLGRNTTNLFIAIGLVTWPSLARLVRAEFLRLRSEEFVQAAKVVGASDQRIILVHLLPNMLAPVIVAITFGIPQAIIAEAFLSFIGIGAPPPTPSWGLMLNDGFRWLRVSPHMALFPGLAIALTLLSFNFLGDGLRDALDPRQMR